MVRSRTGRPPSGEAGAIQVRLLGPIEVLINGSPRPVAGLRRNALLAALALHPGRIVSTDQLIEIVWHDTPPDSPARTLRSHLSHLRRRVDDPTAIRYIRPGYRLSIETADGTDLRTAERLIDTAARATDPARAATALQTALALWRGQPLAGLDQLPWFARQAQHLDRLLAQARHALIEARLALGEHTQLVPELEDLCRQHPLHEPTYGQLMLALYRTGRRIDALAVYRRLQRHLDDELAVPPNPALHELHVAIRDEDPALSIRWAAASVPAHRTPVPAQLPQAITAFTGRTRELAHLSLTLPAAGAAHPPTAAVAVIAGTAGVGKTTLALHWAHQVARQFPDGQLYVNLRGFDPAGARLDPADAIRGFLDAFGTPVDQLPATLDAQIAGYRAHLAGKRVLIVLDNAYDLGQVRPLLPETPGCITIVTSRSNLDGLASEVAVRPLLLDLPTVQDARDLLACRLGPDRVAAEPDAVDAVIARCARLPLALAIVAARAATHADFPLAALAADLQQAGGALDTLYGGDPSTDIRAVFFCSYRGVSPPAARLFRLLGLHPGCDIGALAAASLAGVSPRHAEQLLAELGRAQLLAQHTPGRYIFHDLLRMYAVEQGQIHDDTHTRAAARRRTLDHYLHAAYAADRLINGNGRDGVTIAAPAPGVASHAPADRGVALDWFAAERQVLVAAVELAADTGLHTHAWQLAWSLNTFLVGRGHWHDNTVTHLTALRAAEALPDRTGEAHTLHGLALGYNRSGHFRKALPCLQQASTAFAAIGDHANQARIHMSLTWVAERLGNPGEALDHALRAYDLYQTAGHRAGQAAALNDIGWCHAQLGDHEAALERCRTAVHMHHELGNREGLAAAWDSLGYIHRQRHSYAESLACYQHSVGLWRELGDQFNEADTLNSVGDTHHDAGDPDTARTMWRRALDALDQLNHPDADDIRAKLTATAIEREGQRH